MRAWYGRGRYWFVVAASAGASTAWGWYGYRARWELLGREYVDWWDSDFADAIELTTVPAELIETLAATLDGLSPTWTDDRIHIRPPLSGTLH